MTANKCCFHKVLYLVCISLYLGHDLDKECHHRLFHNGPDFCAHIVPKKQLLLLLEHGYPKGAYFLEQLADIVGITDVVDEGVQGYPEIVESIALQVLLEDCRHIRIPQEGLRILSNDLFSQAG